MTDPPTTPRARLREELLAATEEIRRDDLRAMLRAALESGSVPAARLLAELAGLVRDDAQAEGGAVFEIAGLDAEEPPDAA